MPWMTFDSFIVRKKEKKLTKSKAATFQRTSSPLAGNKFRGKELWGVTGERLLFWCYTHRSKGQSTASARLPIWTQTPLPIVWSKGKLVQTTLDVYYEKGRTSTGWALWTKQTHIALRVHTGVTYRYEYVHLKVTTNRVKPAENHQIVLPLVKKKP